MKPYREGGSKPHHLYGCGNDLKHGYGKGWLSLRLQGCEATWDSWISCLY